MSTQPAPSPRVRQTGAERTRRWRERMRAKGLVPRTVWTYDVNDPAFLEELRQAGERIRGSEEERRVMEEIEAMTDWSWTPAPFVGDEAWPAETPQDAKG